MIEFGGNFLSGNQCLIVTGAEDDDVYKITNSRVTKMPEYKSDQEESDTRMILHSTLSNAACIVVISSDTDVLVLLLHHRHLIKAEQLDMLTGNVSKEINLQHYIPVHTIFNKLTHEQCNILLSVYCLTGCDTVSSFLVMERNQCLKIMMQKSSFFQDLKHIGNELKLSRIEIKCATQFVAVLYGADTTCSSLNQLRCEKANKKTTCKKLPPTDDSFRLHLLRVLYQLHIWKKAHVGMQLVPSPVGFGFDITSEGLKPKLMNQQPAAPELLDDLVCFCEPNSCHIDCSCLQNNQPCTADCNCEGEMPYSDADVICTNPLTSDELHETSDNEHEL